MRLRLAIAIENVRVLGLCPQLEGDCPYGVFSMQSFRLLAGGGGGSSRSDFADAVRQLVQDLESAIGCGGSSLGAAGSSCWVTIAQSGWPIFLLLRCDFHCYYI